MQAMTRSDKKRGVWEEEEWEEEGDEDDEDGEAEGGHVPALPERGGATTSPWGGVGAGGGGGGWVGLQGPCCALLPGTSLPPLPPSPHTPHPPAPAPAHPLAHPLAHPTRSGASSKPVLSSFDSSKFSLAFGHGLRDLGTAHEID